MTAIVISDSDDAATALAELLYAHLDHQLNDPSLGAGDGDWDNFCHLLATLACNPRLFNCLSQDEVDGLVYRADQFQLQHDLAPAVNDFMFDFVAE